MSQTTGIEWTDRTWNPVVGCTKVSQGCKHCYAKTLHDMRHKAFKAGKLQNIPQYAEPFETVQTIPARLRDPLGWRKPSRVFVNSMSDLFHEDIPDAFLDQVFAVMALASQHTFQVLTKRPQRMHDYVRGLADVGGSGRGFRRLEAGARSVGYTMEFQGIPLLAWPIPNVWLGVSVENQAAADERIPLLLRTPAAVRFLSCEPLLGPVDLHRIELPPEYNITLSTPGLISALTPDHEDRYYSAPASIDWVIAGGESGRGARPCELDWLASLRNQCASVGVPFFLKQLGGISDPRAHDKALLDGARHVEMPESREP